MKVLWVGPIVLESDVNASPAISPAANDWQLGFIKGLNDNNIEVSILSYFPEPIFPKGNFYVDKKSLVTSASKIKFISYLNLIYIRDYIFSTQFKDELENMIERGDKPDIIITYNTSKANCAIGTFFQRKYAGTWVSIIADGYSKGYPDKEIYLSYGYFCKSPNENKLHIDGATSFFKGTSIIAAGKRVIIFSGSLDKWTGIEEFALQFSKLDLKNFELHIYGKGSNNTLKKIADEERNVHLKGFVSSEELGDACKYAYAFANPRPTNLPGVENNFPSKILHYITFGKPVLSTRTAGISPIYDDLLYFYNPLDINSLDTALRKLDNLSENDLFTIQQKSRSFCEKSTWKKQTAKMLRFLEEGTAHE